MRETRYDRINGFFWHRKGAPFPGNDVHRLGEADGEFRFSGKTAEEAKKAFASFAREHGANAALNSSVGEVRGRFGRTAFVCSSTPALFARPDPEGSFTADDLLESFVDPSEEREEKEEIRLKPVDSADYAGLVFASVPTFILLMILSPVRTLYAIPPVLVLMAVWNFLHPVPKPE